LYYFSFNYRYIFYFDIGKNVTVGLPPELYPESSKNIDGHFSKGGSHIPITGRRFSDMRLDEIIISPMGDRLVKLFKKM
jgi:hypothetical protein